ncbi:hypothetical protein [Providencia stuartii]|uniref:hypothetical protein n=1 Tax=Providencia stuartii TaxID=588 RepID=UPI003D7E0083
MQKKAEITRLDTVEAGAAVVKIVLTPEQIKSLNEFAQEEGQPSYTVEVGTICDGDDIIYEGLIAYSGSEEHGVLQLE